MKYIQPVHVTNDTDMSYSQLNDMEPMEDSNTDNSDFNSPHVEQDNVTQPQGGEHVNTSSVTCTSTGNEANIITVPVTPDPAD